MTRKFLTLAILSVCCLSVMRAQAQTDAIPLTDLSAFADPGPSWQIVGSAISDLGTNERLITTPGTSVLANLPGANGGSDLYTSFEHGDADVELEFLMAKHSNSGIYLQGQYEIQLLDSHGKTTAKYSDCGGIYQRWDEGRGTGNEGYQGHAPRVNVAKAPGLWQHLAISFQAARFAPDGSKTENAKILSVHLNGQLIHENVSLTGPTRGSDEPEDIATGPLRIQGDHGPVAFRNIRVRSYGNVPATVSDLSYKVYTGTFDHLPMLSSMTPVASGDMEALTSEVVEENEGFILAVKGQLHVPTPGTYQLDLNTLGNGTLIIDGKTAVEYGWWNQSGMIELMETTVPFELVYHKRESWYNNGFSLHIAGPGLRTQQLSIMSSMPLGSPTRPIYLNAGTRPELMRCFIDYTDANGSRRIPHAISVSTPAGLHYTIDPERGALVQAWKGDFLDATPMWNSRGDGSSRPRGAVEPFGDDAGIAVAAASQSKWPEEVPESLNYHFSGYGYAPDQSYNPVFRYEIGGVLVEDQWSVESPESGLTRSLMLEGQVPAGTLLRLAAGKTIDKVPSETGSTVYAVDQRYYVSLPSAMSVSVIDRGEEKALVADLSKSGDLISYNLIW